ncbi:50S ribosomal protein L35 [Candidatus Bipolaricaulota bacterium]|nr:50S ribosomal protein L35 [Candidatus Bipolaricaulota bacterium]
MPKQKTHRAASKRFKRSKSGKLFHHMSNYFHKNVKKRSKSVRQARKGKELTGNVAKNVKRLLGK